MKKHLLATITFFCGTLSLSAQIPTNGLISKWSFESRITSEFTKDEQGSHPLINNGAVTGAPRTTLDTANAVFGNTSMTVNNAAFRPISFSIATWFKITGSTPFHTLASVRIQNSGAPFNSYNLNIGTSTSSKLTFFLSTTQSNDAQVQNPISTSSNVWTHAAVTCDYISSEDSTAVKMYVNSALVAQKKVKSYITYNTSNNPLVLGSVTGAPNGNSLFGNLDNVMFYNRPLTALEVSNIYSGTAIPTTGLISYWKFNQVRIEHDSQNAFPLTNNGGAPATGITNLDSTALTCFSGTNMSVNDAVFRDKTFSFATWFKIMGVAPYHTIANVRFLPSSSPFNSYNLNIGSSVGDRLTFLFSTTLASDIQVQNSSTTASNAWTHAVITCGYNTLEDSTSVKMYVNNVVVAQTKVKSYIIYNGTTPPLVLGSVAGAPNGNSLQGNLDEFLYYNRVLTPSEVATIYNGTATGIHSSINNQNSGITIYPNPTNSILNIEVKEQTQISIINLLGEVLKTETINGASKLDVSALNSGVYFIQDSKSGKAIKFIKE
jgi:hypothetical protein